MATFGAALDLVIAMPFSWLPLVADYNRFARGAGAAFAGTFARYLVANIWMYTLGAMLLLSGGAIRVPQELPQAFCGRRRIAGILFLVGLLVGDADEAFADVHSSGLSRTSSRRLLGACSSWRSRHWLQR